jgi:hypothetical protein
MVEIPVDTQLGLSRAMFAPGHWAIRRAAWDGIGGLGHPSDLGLARASQACAATTWWSGLAAPDADQPERGWYPRE